MLFYLFPTEQSSVIQMPSFSQMDALCWECHAYLCKIQMFQKRVQRAQELLNIEKNTLISLSQLATRLNPNIDINDTGEVILKLEKKEDVLIEYKADNDFKIDNFEEHKLKTENSDIDYIDDGSEVETDSNSYEIDSKLSRKCDFKRKNSKTPPKVLKKCTRKKKGVDAKKTNLKNSKVKSTSKLNVESSLNDEMCNDLLKSKCDNSNSSKISNVFVKLEPKDAAKKSKVNKVNSKNSYTKNKKSLKYRHLDINDLFDKAFKEETIDNIKSDSIDEKPDTQECNLPAIDTKLYGCKVCSTVVKSVDRELHMKSHYTLMQCLTCELICDGRQEFFKHYKNWHSKYICDHCEVKFKMRSAMEKHVRTFHMPVTCKYCGKKFSNYHKWKKHYRCQHLQTSPAYCVECDLSFDNDYRYRRHLTDSVRHKPRPKVSIPCPDCDKVFSKKIYMKLHHSFVHLQQYNNRCEVCDKNFLRKSALARHNRHVHDGILPSKNKICYICGKGFTTNRTLSNHIVTHTGERPYECELCNARFTQSTALATHRRARHPEAGPLLHPHQFKRRAFPCDLCTAKYTTAERLEKHKRDIHLVTKTSTYL